MNLSPRWVEFLGHADVEAVPRSAVGRPDAPDTALLEYAANHDCVIVTQDLDFGMLLARSGAAMPSVVQIRARATLPSDMGVQLLEALRVVSSYLETGALVTLDSVGHRVTVLPLPAKI